MPVLRGCDTYVCVWCLCLRSRRLFTIVSCVPLDCIDEETGAPDRL